MLESWRLVSLEVTLPLRPVLAVQDWTFFILGGNSKYSGILVLLEWESNVPREYLHGIKFDDVLGVLF